MKVQIVRLVTGSCLTFLIVFCCVYTMGILFPNRTQANPKKTSISSQSTGGTQSNNNVIKVVSHETGAPAKSDATSTASQPDESWFQGTAQDRTRFEHLLRSRQAPALTVNQWTNTTPLPSSAREGKIVVLTFWSTWSQPCLKAIAFNNAIHQHYKDKDVLFIGVCKNDGSKDMANIVDSRGIEYPVAIDAAGNVSLEAYDVQAIPSYFVIDRTGQLRFADLKRGRVDDAIEYLLNRD